MSGSSNCKARPSLQKKRCKDIKRLQREGANFVLSVERLAAEQLRFIERLKASGASKKLRKRIAKCGPSRCALRQCSAACWWGERAYVNALTLQAMDVLDRVRGDRTLRFVTVIDPTRAFPAGRLSTFSAAGLMQAVRRAFRDGGDELADAIAFAYVELAVEIMLDGRELWSPHVHMLIVSSASDKRLKRILRPKRKPPVPETPDQKRRRPVLVLPAKRLAYLLDYIAKRKPEVNLNGRDKDGQRGRWPAPLPLHLETEWEQWLLDQRPGHAVFLRGLRRVRGQLTVR